MKNGTTRIALAGAQTGGHLLPAVETGKILQAMGCEVTLVTSGDAIEKTILKESGIPVRTLSVGRLKGMGLLRGLKGFMSIPGAMLRAGSMLREIRPDVVAGFGGFTSGPFVLAAALSGIPSAVFEANSVPGMTNRILAKFAKKVFVTFECAADRIGRGDAVVTGNPVRASILAISRAAYVAPGRRVLVIGGSQGSRFLNENMPPVFEKLAGQVDGLQVRHQCGLGKAEAVDAMYQAMGVEAKATDYIQDMADAYRWADFIVCRSGAGTVSEVSVVGLPALYVPFAAAADDHQAGNAMDVAASGAALMIREGEFDHSAVASALAGILNDIDRLNGMATAAKAAGRRDAADLIANGIVGMVKR